MSKKLASDFWPLMLLWLVGLSLRITLLCVPPVIPEIHDQLRLSATQVGFLNGLPSSLFALAAVPGSLLIARLGVRNALTIGLLLTAVCGALRGLINDIGWLYVTTALMSAGVAVLQVTMPTAVRDWVPTHIAFATALYTNGLLVGEVLPAALTSPMLMTVFGGSWQWTFAFWSIPVCITALLVQLLVRQPSQSSVTRTITAAWWPDWRNKVVWRLGIMLGGVNAIYFATNAFIPGYLREHGQGQWISYALSGFNLGQLPASVILLCFAHQLQLRAWPIIGCCILCTAATAGIVFGSGLWVIAAAVLSGFAASAVFILILALPPLISPPGDLHRVAAAMFTISYSCSVVIPTLSGLFWDWTGAAAFAFVPIAACSFVVIALAQSIRKLARS